MRQEAQQELHAFAARFHERYRAYALHTPPAWLDAVDGGAVRQASACAVAIVLANLCCPSSKPNARSRVAAMSST